MPRRTRTGSPRWSTRTGAGLLAGAGLLTVAALVVAGRPDGGADTSAPPASAPVVPSTIGPAVSPTTPDATAGPVAGSLPATGPSPSPSPSAPTTTIVPSTTLPLSPLNAVLGDAVSAVPAAVVSPPEPTRISIEALGVEFPIRAVGVDPNGQLEIPDETEVGWYRLGATPGETGSAVLAGHVSWNRTDGPFRDLGQLQPGALVRVDLADGTARTYSVVERAQYPKTALPAERIWAHAGPETLVLITCGGAFNPEIRRYADNIVVYAVPVA